MPAHLAPACRTPASCKPHPRTSPAPLTTGGTRPGRGPARPPTACAPAAGWTLVESCVTLAVLAVLLVAGVPSLRNLLDTRRLDGVAVQLAADLHFAKAQAVARNQPMRLRFTSGPGPSTCYAVQPGEAEACPCPAAAGTCPGSLKSVTLDTSNPIALAAPTESLLFDPLHGTSTPAGTLRVIGSDGRAIHQVVSVMGRVRSCSPDARVTGYPAC